ncbi:cytochrome P450 6k1-like [Schistocerca cancellata]|uniref:cytochrome P450 6k1-like n=1 Tax=Schistocerca cancellata TaxID=274614 RepID=UPI0021175FB7|nr:cytochrome P450 6k1-like [Schistocerca cancellata]
MLSAVIVTWVSLALVAAVAALSYAYLWSLNNYWKRLGVPATRPELFFGDTRRVLFATESFSAMLQTLYNQLDGKPFGGFYMMMTPCIILRDVSLINRILVTDFSHFSDRLGNPWTKTTALGQHMLILTGVLWEEMRLRTNLVFTVEHMRRDFFLVKECCTRLQDSVKARINGQPSRDLELKDLLSSFTTDVIGMCAFGIECGAIDDPNSQFRRFADMIFDKTRKGSLRGMILLMLPQVSMLLGSNFFYPHVMKFFNRVFTETIHYRKGKGIIRDDLMHMLMELKEKGLKSGKNGESIEITDSFLAAQVLIAFALAFDMMSWAMCFCLHELSLKPDLQTRARMEIDAALRRHCGEISYEALQEMAYLDMVVAESLRMYPPMGQLLRQCTKPYRVPGSDVVLAEGTLVFVPVLALHRDHRLFPEPLRFNPDRFAAGELQGSPLATTYLPFGAGPRNCPGDALALVQMKAGLAALLSRYELRQCPRSSGSPAALEQHGFFCTPAGGLWIRVSPRPWLPVL